MLVRAKTLKYYSMGAGKEQSAAMGSVGKKGF
jgi:hypothetical protein